MKKESAIKLFEDKKIRSIWNEEEEEWYFSLVDVIDVLTDSANSTDYLKKLFILIEKYTSISIQKYTNLFD